MIEFETIYKNSLLELNSISKNIENDLRFDIDKQPIEKSESSLDIADYCFTFLFGFIGAIVSTSEQLEKYLAGIHNAASEVDGDCDKFQILMGKLLHHKGDSMDKMINRDNKAAYIGFHRLLWGHDVLSLDKDNPFLLMINQKGSKLNGVLQALKHLIADTMSKQGLPIPGTSALDYITEEGKRTNYIIDLANNLSIEGFDHKGMSQEIYSHLFTIRAQDIAGGALAKILTEVYFKARKIKNNVRKSQMLFMVYAINFFVEAIIGSIKQNGVPYINISVGTSMMVSFVKFCYFEEKELSAIKKGNNNLFEKTDELVEKYEYHKSISTENNSVDKFYNELLQSNENMNYLIDFLWEDKV